MNVRPLRMMSRFQVPLPSQCRTRFAYAEAYALFGPATHSPVTVALAERARLVCAVVRSARIWRTLPGRVAIHTSPVAPPETNHASQLGVIKVQVSFGVGRAPWPDVSIEPSWA